METSSPFDPIPAPVKAATIWSLLGFGELAARSFRACATLSLKSAVAGGSVGCPEAPGAAAGDELGPAAGETEVAAAGAPDPSGPVLPVAVQADNDANVDTATAMRASAR